MLKVFWDFQISFDRIPIVVPFTYSARLPRFGLRLGPWGSITIRHNRDWRQTMFLAVQDSSIGDIVTESVSDVLILVSPEHD